MTTYQPQPMTGRMHRALSGAREFLLKRDGGMKAATEARTARMGSGFAHNSCSGRIATHRERNRGGQARSLRFIMRIQ